MTGRGNTGESNVSTFLVWGTVGKTTAANKNSVAHRKKKSFSSHTGCHASAAKVNSFIAQTDYVKACVTYLSHCTALQ